MIKLVNLAKLELLFDLMKYNFGIDKISLSEDKVILLFTDGTNPNESPVVWEIRFDSDRLAKDIVSQIKLNNILFNGKVRVAHSGNFLVVDLNDAVKDIRVDVAECEAYHHPNEYYSNSGNRD